jgi:hypothetical protein
VFSFPNEKKYPKWFEDKVKAVRRNEKEEEKNKQLINYKYSGICVNHYKAADLTEHELDYV